MTPTASTRGQLNDLVAALAQRDAEYRKRLLEEPKSVLEEQTGYALPASLQVVVLQETARTAYIVLPHEPEEDTELDDADLEKVAGGKGAMGGGPS